VKCQELNAGAKRLGNEPKVMAGRMVCGQAVQCPTEVQQQVKDQARLCLGLQEIQIHRGLRGIIPPFGLEPMPDQFIGAADIGLPWSGRESPRASALLFRRLPPGRLLFQELSQSDMACLAVVLGRQVVALHRAEQIAVEKAEETAAIHQIGA
jgi:hypothetical protein